MTFELPLRLVLLGLQAMLAPFLIGCWLEAHLSGSERWFAACSELLSLAPGWPGSMLRKAFYRATLRGCADRAYISFGVLFAHRSASIGRGVYIGPYSIIGAANIEDGVKIASRVSIMSGRVQHRSQGGAGASTKPRLSAVSIGAGSWIGEGAVVMANIGAECVVGAGSVVVHDVARGATVVGNPAREVSRGQDSDDPQDLPIAQL